MKPTKSLGDRLKWAINDGFVLLRYLRKKLTECQHMIHLVIIPHGREVSIMCRDSMVLKEKKL